MTEDHAQAPWPSCQAPSSCPGSALPPWGRCLGHLAPDDFEQAIKRAKTEGLDARGVTLTPSLLDRIFSLLDRTNQDAPIVPNARFARATFSGDAGFVVSLSGKLPFLSVRAAKRLWLALHDDSTEGDSTVDLTAASFAGPAVVAASPAGAGSRRPRLVSLEQIDTANLTVSGLDLSDCRFLGVINLDRLRIDGSLLLRSAPGWWRAQRQVLWEEGKLRGWWGRKAPNTTTALRPC